MAIVKTTFVTANDVIIPSEFRSSNPKRCKLSTINLNSDLQNEYGVDQLQIIFPFGPRDMQFGSQASVVDQIARPGKKPLLEKKNDPLRIVSFNAVIASTAGFSGERLELMSGTTPVDPAMQTIERIATSGATCKFVYGTVALGYYVMLTRFDFTIKHRDSEGHPVRVDAQFQLTEKPVFSQELVNLPVMPIDPPELPIPNVIQELTDRFYHVLSNHSAKDAYDSYVKLIEAAKQAGVEVDATVHARAQALFPSIFPGDIFGPIATE